MKGKWAQGLRPRAFTWVIKDRIGVSERPGGYARNHRKVRRDEELIWLEQNGFTHVLSLLDSPHNLSAYEEAGIPHAHIPLGRPGAEVEALPQIYELLLRWYLNPSELVLVHHEEFGDRVCGVIGGFLLAAGLLDSGPTAVAVTERLTGRQLGPEGRSIVRATIEAGLAPKVQEEAPAEVRIERLPGPTKIKPKAKKARAKPVIEQLVRKAAPPAKVKAAKKKASVAPRPERTTAARKRAIRAVAKRPPLKVVKRTRKRTGTMGPPSAVAKAVPKTATMRKSVTKPAEKAVVAKAVPKKAVPKKAAPKKAAPKKAAPKKAAPKKAAPKKAAPKKAAPKKAAPKKAAPKKAAPKKAAPKKAAPKKPVTRETVRPRRPVVARAVKKRVRPLRARRA